MSRDRKPVGSSSQRRTEDVIWDLEVDSYDDIPLVPIDPEDERRRIRPRESMLPVGVVYEEDEEDPPLQFSIRHILVSQGIVAMMLGLIKLLVPSLLAGTLGILAVCAALFISIYEPEDKRIRHAWWGLFGFYLAACIGALALGNG